MEKRKVDDGIGESATGSTSFKDGEPRLRSLAKALSWRVAALVVTTSVAWMITREASIAATVGAADAALKILLYYLHERAWNRSSFGRDGLRYPFGRRETRDATADRRRPTQGACGQP